MALASIRRLMIGLKWEGNILRLLRRNLCNIPLGPCNSYMVDLCGMNNIRHVLNGNPYYCVCRLPSHPLLGEWC